MCFVLSLLGATSIACYLGLHVSHLQVQDRGDFNLNTEKDLA